MYIQFSWHDSVRTPVCKSPKVVISPRSLMFNALRRKPYPARLCSMLAAAIWFKATDIDESKAASHSSWSALSMAAEKLPCLAGGTECELFRPCVDCGLITGSFCDFCKAADWLPDEAWAEHQVTPLCTRCDRMRDACHFCRGEHWCVPPPRRS